MPQTLKVNNVPKAKLLRVEAAFRSYGAQVKVKANRDGKTCTVAARFGT
jgi:hypothetical protein